MSDIDNEIENETEEPVEEVIITGKLDIDLTGDTFEQLKLSQPILNCVKKVGFTHPTPIQQAVIPPALKGDDLIGLAQTGSGKTAAFVIPMAERLAESKNITGLILCPTREIAIQTKAFLDLFGTDHHLSTVCLIGGMRMGKQLNDLKNKPNIVVATPGRLIDHIRRKSLTLEHVQELVLDEADHMLDMGFMPQIRTILSMLPKKRHSVMFSATMPPAIESLARQFLNNPTRIDILPKGGAAVKLTHQLFLVNSEDDKKNALIHLLKNTQGLSLVFAARKIDIDWLDRTLEKEGLSAAKLHSDLSQKDRTQTMENFRDKKCKVLLATDIASRGIDVPGITHVINFDIPDNVEDYIHRGGRTARAKAEGLVSSLGLWKDISLVKKIEFVLGHPIPRQTIEGIKPFVEIQVPAGGRRRR